MNASDSVRMSFFPGLPERRLTATGTSENASKSIIISVPEKTTTFSVVVVPPFSGSPMTSRSSSIVTFDCVKDKSLYFAFMRSFPPHSV